MKGWHYFLSAIKKTFVLKGRARRAEFGWFYLISFFIFAILNALYLLTTFFYERGVIQRDTDDIISLYLTHIIEGFGFWFLIAALFMITRRLHDIGKSGLWLLVGFYMPVLSIIIAPEFGVLNDLDTGSVSFGTKITLWLIFFYFCCIMVVHFWLVFKKGEPTKNQYGEPQEALK